MARLVAFAGSSREGSYNRMLVRIAAAGAREAGAQVEVLELSDYPMPMMNEDLERDKGMPERASEFKRKLLESDGFIISAPEYNSSITPLLKNALDWASRQEEDGEKPLTAFRGRYAVLMSASPGSLGGLRGLVPLRMMLGNLGVTVIPDSRSVSDAGNAFEPDGSLRDSKLSRRIEALGRTLAETVERMKNGTG